MATPPELTVTIQSISDPDTVLQGTFMGMIESKMVMLALGNEKGDVRVNSFALVDEYLVTSIEDERTGKFTHPEATIEDQEGCVDILQHAAKFMAA